jgi:hypothetical protein
MRTLLTGLLMLLLGLTGLLDRVSAESTTTLAGPEQFAAIADDRERAAKLFVEMGKVLQHPRCVNCHPKSDRPLQGDDRVLHQPPVYRGAGGMGLVGMRCNTCHSQENVAYATAEGSIPGHRVWLLAPASMAWEDKSLAEICAQIKDKERNGGKTLAQLQAHNAKDGLVGWGWHPGEGREPAPGDQATFGALTKAWIDAGAHCPPG